MNHAGPSTARARPLVGWRLLSLLYDLFPMLGIWFVVGIVSLALHRGEAIRSNSLAGALELLALLAVTGLYATASWRRGGQTIGMKPWRLYVVTGVAGEQVSWGRLWLRYGVGIVSLLCAGLGFWWAWLDRAGLTWHDRLSGTRMIREVPAKPAKQASRG
ncbi:hypothetical protein DCD74_08285 [Lysobacter oculi]|uniref:RDD domain-containing protein n=1 Tax=Solilutibacter oculi TaxID=2698682 RepID=A0A344J6M3_9GAMM|nr:RDD family protein [Lysobacter oculi]AXA84683.1 hypothetical protein DCD74_08285 [Lysobacter oculi]